MQYVVQSYTQASFKVDYWRRSAVVVFMVACGSLVITTTSWPSPTIRIHLPICWELQERLVIAMIRGYVTSRNLTYTFSL